MLLGRVPLPLDPRSLRESQRETVSHTGVSGLEHIVIVHMCLYIYIYMHIIIIIIMIVIIIIIIIIIREPCFPEPPPWKSHARRLPRPSR